MNDPKPVESPSPIAIARQLCSIASRHLKDSSSTYERDCLNKAFRHLELDPPDLEAALYELGDGLAHAFRHGFVEDRPEVWLAAAANRLLRLPRVV